MHMQIYQRTDNRCASIVAIYIVNRYSFIIPLQIVDTRTVPKLCICTCKHAQPERRVLLNYAETFAN